MAPKPKDALYLDVPSSDEMSTVELHHGASNSSEEVSKQRALLGSMSSSLRQRRSQRRKGKNITFRSLPLLLSLGAIALWTASYYHVYQNSVAQRTLNDLQGSLEVQAVQAVEQDYVSYLTSGSRFTTVCGYVASLVACLAFGSFAVPIKTEAMRKIPVDPLGKCRVSLSFLRRFSSDTGT